MTASVEAVVRADRNESAFDPTPEVRAALAECALEAHRYPSYGADGARHAIARHVGVDDTQVTVGPGATAVVAAVLADCVAQARSHGCRHPEILTPAPTFEGFGIIAHALDTTLRTSPLTDDGVPDIDSIVSAITDNTVAIIVCSPHNPTGAILDDSMLRHLLDRVPDGIRLILDEAYIEYSPCPPDTQRLVADHPQLVVLRTFSKAYGLAGLRAGYAFGSEKAIAGPRSRELPFALSAAAQAAIPIVLADRRALRDRVVATRRHRDLLVMALTSLGIHVLPGHANFVFLPGQAGLAVGEVLARSGVIGKPCGDAGLRLTVPDATTTHRVIAVLTG